MVISLIRKRMCSCDFSTCVYGCETTCVHKELKLVFLKDSKREQKIKLEGEKDPYLPRDGHTPLHSTVGEPAPGL